MRVTLRDVAKESGVSLATASRALSGGSGVSPAVRHAVVATSRRMDYQPSAIAAAMRSKSTGALGMLIPDITNPFFPAVVQGVEHEFARDNLTLVLCDSQEDVEVEAARLETLIRRRVDALIVCPVDAVRSAPALRSAMRHVRVIQIDRHAVDDADFVGVDEAVAMTQIVEHLREQGAGTAVFVGVHPTMSAIAEREAGFVAACRRFGIAAAPSIPADRLDLDTGRTIAGQLLGGGAMPQAIVCANDLLAFGVLSEFRRAGRRCPEDVLITGFDDDAPASELLGLTTSRQPLADLGREAARLLQSPSGTPRSVRLNPTLVVRGTTRPD